MVDTPENIGTGRVVGRFIAGVIDGPDENQEPDLIPAEGTVEFDASVSYLLNLDDPAGPVIIALATMVGILDEYGFLCTPDPNDPTKAGYRGVRLFATDDEDSSVTGWSWRVTHKLHTKQGGKITLPITNIPVPTGEDTYLPNFVKVPSSPGIGIPQYQAAILRAEGFADDSAQSAATALSVVSRADAGDFDGAQGDPGNATMRVDNTVGKRVFITDGATEHMVSGDTGMRDITALLAGVVFDKTGARKLLMSRVGHAVEISGQLLVAQDAASGQTFLNVPNGFQVAGRVETTGAQIRGEAAMARISGSAGLGLYTFVGATYTALKGGDVINLSISYQTTDAWPTSLPGTPA